MLRTLLRRVFRGAGHRASLDPRAADVRCKGPDDAVALAALLAQGHRYAAEGNLDCARAAFEQALDSGFESCECRVALGSVYAQLGDASRARALLESALEVSPHDAAAHDILGNVLREQGLLTEAIACYARALDAEPNRASALSNQALCLRDLGRFEEARERLQRAAELDPSNATVRSNLAALLFDLSATAAAMEIVDAILGEQPDHAPTRVTRAFALLRSGDFTRGWLDYEWREHDASWATFAYPEWDGAPIDKEETLLVCGEQGLGDQIMFASCIRDVLRVAPRCMIECDLRLKNLFGRSFPQTRVYARRKKPTQPWLEDGVKPAAKTRIGSLPLRFRNRSDDFVQNGAYLKADSRKIGKWSSELAALGSGLKVGISWRGGVATTRRTLRSIDLARWDLLLSCPGVRFVSLQYGDCIDEVENVSQTLGVRVTHWQHAIEDYEETAALVCALDLVISVQTSLVHLAGALGKKVWVLVPQSAEWRYGETTTTMPWYASARLFRQTVANSWDEVFLEIRSRLAREVPGT